MGDKGGRVRQHQPSAEQSQGSVIDISIAALHAYKNQERDKSSPWFSLL